MSDSRIRRLLEAGAVEGIKETSDGFTARCPFHDTRDGTPFTINARAGHKSFGRWQCWSCKAAGNLFGLARRLFRRVSSPRDFARLLAELPRPEAPPPEELPVWPSFDERGEEEPTLSEATLGVYDWCPAYMVERGFDVAVMRHFDIGFDQAAQRVTIPVRNAGGRLVGISRRATHADQQPKYLHDVPTGRYLYNLHDALEAARELPRSVPVYAVEGQLDVLWLVQLAVNERQPTRLAVGTLGTSLSSQNCDDLVTCFGDRPLVLAFDNDDAGRFAQRKAAEALLPRVRDLGILSYPTADPGELTARDFQVSALVPALDWLLRDGAAV